MFVLSGGVAPTHQQHGQGYPVDTANGSPSAAGGSAKKREPYSRRVGTGTGTLRIEDVDGLAPD